jgi:hypothetical protein
MMAYNALSQKPTMLENARFWAGVLTAVKAPENAAHIAPVMSMDSFDLKKRLETMYMLTNGPKMPTTDEMVQSR